MSNRTYSAVPNDNHQVANFPYIWDASLVQTGGSKPLTGNWRPTTTADFGSANLSISGLSLTVGAVAVTGIVPVTIAGGSITVVNGVLPTSGTATILNTAPIPFSGVTVANTVDTGVRAVNVTNTAPIPFSGSVMNIGGFIGLTGSPLVSLGNAAVNVTGTIFTITTGTIGGNVTVNSVAVTGFSPLIAPLAISGIVTASVSTVDTGNRSVQVVNTAPIPVSGVVQAQVTIGALAITGFNSTIAPLAITGIVTALTVDTGVRAVNVVNTIAQSITGTVQTVDPTGNLFLASISGSLITLLADNSAITGFNSTIAPLAISGVVNTTVTIGNVAITGVVNTVDITGNLYLAAISGALTANLNGAAPVSGLVGITNTAPIAISGVVNTVVTGTVSASVPNPLGVTGTSVDSNTIFTGLGANRFLAGGGRVYNPSGAGSITGGYATGGLAMFTLSPVGALYVSQGVLDKNYDQVTVFPAATGIASANTVSGLAGIIGWGTPLPSNPNRRAWGITNMTTGVIFVRMGVGATSGNAHFVLKGGTIPLDGLGAVWTDMPAIWQGSVSCTGYFSTNSLYSAWEL